MVVVALIYGTAFPALYVLGLIFCVVAHWIDRYNLLRTFAPPPPTSDRLVAQVLRVVVPCSILLHLVLAVFLFRAKASATAPATLMAYGRALRPAASLLSSSASGPTPRASRRDGRPDLALISP